MLDVLNKQCTYRKLRPAARELCSQGVPWVCDRATNGRVSAGAYLCRCNLLRGKQAPRQRAFEVGACGGGSEVREGLRYKISRSNLARALEISRARRALRLVHNY